jgi:fructan beta-fructosidase
VAQQGADSSSQNEEGEGNVWVKSIEGAFLLWLALLAWGWSADDLLIGGGKYPGKAGINLVVDGKVVRTASDKKANVLVEKTMELTLTKKYLNVPVKTGAPKGRMSLIIDGKTAREFEVELAPAQPDFWAFLDVSAFQGKKATLRIDRAPEDSAALNAVEQSDEIKGVENLYKEKLRPQFHFTSRRGWNNDPNGLVYYKGEYHLFYQHNPYGWNWGNMHWGHAVSKDLVHWQELPVALYPRAFGDWAFSGSATVDAKNTAGFKSGDEDVIVAAYTSTGRGECIVFSNDRGRTFTEFDGNPVVVHRGRDPKIIWFEPGQHWVMAVYDEVEEKRCIAFYTSPDLKRWTFLSRIEGYYECPEIFEMPVDGDKNNRKWIVYAADGSYAIGRFDGKTFTTESGKHPFNYGNCFYASQTFNNVPPADGRRIQIAWGTVSLPGMPFNQMMNFPVELTLRTTDEGLRLFANPVKEIESLRAKKHEWKDFALNPGDNPLSNISGELFDISAEFAIGDAAEIGFLIRGVPIIYDAKAQQLACADKRAPLKPTNGTMRLRLLVDRTSIEIFGNDGRIYMPMGMHPADDNKSLSVFSQGGSARVVGLRVYELKSIW